MRTPIMPQTADDILRQFQEDLNIWFGLTRNPVKPEHRLTEETADKFARLLKEDDRLDRIEERIAAIERKLASQ